jgi:DNA-binding NtrC family response regulator
VCRSGPTKTDDLTKAVGAHGVWLLLCVPDCNTKGRARVYNWWVSCYSTHPTLRTKSQFTLESTPPISTSLHQLLDASSRPVYAVDARRQVVYCNPALAAWLAMDAARIVGRRVEYHSEAAAERGTGGSASPLTDLCPPPQALAGAPTLGTISSFGRDGRLIHRRAEFVPLTAAGQKSGGVLVLLAEADMSPQELAATLADEPTADELHRTIRSFRRQQAAEYAVESLLGESAGMRKVRAQVAAAAASQANVLVRGARGTGREHIARAIHYHAKDPAGKLVPIDCATATEESLRRALESLRGPRDPKQRHTLLLVNLELLPAALQTLLVPTLAAGTLGARTVATTTSDREAEIDPQLLSAVSTIRIDTPTLAGRRDDLPLLAQFFLEAANRGSDKQVGSLRHEVLDQLALYRWPGELDELRGVVAAAHAAATSHEISLADLPPVLHHAAKAAAMPRRAPEKIVLDELLESIEREVITRALAQANGNKSAAAELLGMTRPRLYRRLVQLGFISEKAAEDVSS